MTEPVNRVASADISALVALLWRRRAWVVGAALATGIIAVAISFLVTPTFTTKVSLLPQIQGGPNDILSQIAGLSGVLPTNNSWEVLYPQIITSDRVLDEAIARKWQYLARPDSVSLFTILGVNARGDDPLKDARAVESLKKCMRSQVIDFKRDRATGYMELWVTVPRDPRLAAALANFLIGRLDSYNRVFRRTKAAEQKTFVENRLQAVTGELTTAETALAEFRTRNRTYETSPELLRRYDELAREVGAQTAIWTELKRQLEIAKIDEHREVISVDILDSALPPTLRSSPHRSQYLAIGVFLGALGMMAWILVRQQWLAWRVSNDA